jgi:hypothetical protein
MQEVIQAAIGEFPVVDDVQWIVDIDPQDML